MNDATPLCSRPLVIMALATASLTATPGCVVQDIYDELSATNASLARVESALEGVDTTNAELDRLQVRLETLERIQSIDASLSSIDGQLKPMLEELDALDQHLASLRRTINNIDSTIPFLKVSGDDEAEAETLAENAEAEGGTPAEDAGETAEETPSDTSGNTDNPG